ncbi:metallophosphoesterase [Chryseobacterium caseinilyticum]|uniref:Metallophosphoesterase n=1 Tax=Chryseobacterium caseinilyticum TaxID=2771428 RepID=A0ABR8Z6A5_9FLAO|nr:metallophosphoesterase [Chryseobacterium caseinilyticum]MBD8080813.1 metallophosphoesterase [Chryseobacterium caseinilyticum]
MDHSGTSIGLILLYPLVWYDVLPEKIDRIVRFIVHIDMGMLSLLITFILIRDLLFLPISYFKPSWSDFAFSNYGTYFLILFSPFLLFIGFLRASKGPELVDIQVPVKALPDELHNFSILQISDLHAGAGIDKQYVDRVVEKALNLNADIVVLTGDIADGSFEKYQHNLQSLSRITERFQVYYVTGNHEYLRDSDLWISYFKSIGIKVLLNENTTVNFKGKSILIAGIIDPAAKELKPSSGPDIQKALAGNYEVDFKILLAHQPNIAKVASTHFDLQLSGHTHAGQFFPWNIFINLSQPFAKGLKKCDRMWVYTNSGTGYWGPPFRLGTTSEITLLHLIKQ